jgi:hypothetical protein
VKNQITYCKPFACFAQTFVTFAVKKKFIIINFLLFVLSVSYPFTIYSQSDKLSEIIISTAEELAADDSAPEEAEVFTDLLYDLAENPVSINSSDEAEISRLFFLSDFQVKVIMDYTRSSGRIISFYELVNIPGFDKETVEMMIPFITIDNKVTTNIDPARWSSTSITNLSVRSGNIDTSSTGSAWKILTKYKFKSGSFSGGLTAEKDPGEKFFYGNPPRPEFFSAHIAYNGNGVIRRIIIGDYSARFGQGTNINTGIRTGLSLSTSGYMSAKNEIKPYTSTDENKFFRGVASEFSIKNLGVSLFYSKNHQDATLISSPGASEDYIENFYLTGIHNTPSLLQKKDAVTEMSYGINLSYNFDNLRIGFTTSGDRFSLPVKLEGNDPAEIFDFDGNRNNLYTFSYNGLIKRILLYGEFSANETKKYAFVQGLSFRPSDRLSVNFLFRRYSGGYISFHGKGPGGGSTTGHEQEILGNFTFEAAKHLFISGGCDIHHYFWLKYRCSSPTRGMKQEVRVRFLPAGKLAIEALYNYRFSMTDNSETTGIPEQKQNITRSLKGSLHYFLNDNLTLGTRIDYKIAVPSGSKGILLLQDINYRFRSIPVSIWARFCIFHTDDWDSRIYTYENDLLYSFNIPALSGEGSRSYIMVKWEIGDNAEFRLKYGLTSSIENNTGIKNNEELKIQIRMQF